MKRIASSTTMAELSPSNRSGGPAVARQGRVQLEEVVVRQPLVEAHCAGTERRAGLDGADVPLAEVAGRVAGVAQHVRDGDLLRPHRPVGRERPVAHRVPPGEHAAAEWASTTGAPRRSGPCAGPRGGHPVEHRRLQELVPVVAGLLPAVVVAHQQDEVRGFFRVERRRPGSSSDVTRNAAAMHVRTKPGTSRVFFIAFRSLNRPAAARAAPRCRATCRIACRADR